MADEVTKEVKGAKAAEAAGDKKEAAAKLDKSQKEFDDASEKIMDILDRPENGGMMKDM